MVDDLIPRQIEVGVLTHGASTYRAYTDEDRCDQLRAVIDTYEHMTSLDRGVAATRRHPRSDRRALSHTAVLA